MSFFVNLAKANADNARLNTELAALGVERDTLKAAIAERDAAAESCRAQFDASLADLTEKLSVANSEVSKLQAESKSSGQQAAEVIAAQGVDPGKLPKPQAKAAAPTMPRGQFTTLSPYEQAKFCRDGGRITDN